jgi:MFS family permease
MAVTTAPAAAAAMAAPTITKFATLSASTFLDACSGLSYSFAVWAPHMRDRLALSQAQIAAAGAALNLGGYFALPAGWLYDRLAHLPATGPRVVLWVGALTAALGYAGLWALASGRLLPLPEAAGAGGGPSSSYALLLLLAAVAGNSGVWLDASVLVTNVRNFPQDRGTVVGFLKAFLGLSASLWALPYAALLAPNVDSYLLLLAIAPATVIVLASLLVSHVPFVEACELEEAGAGGGGGGGGRGAGEGESEGEEGGGGGNPVSGSNSNHHPRHHNNNYTLIFPSAPASFPFSLRLRHARRRLAQRCRRALYLPPARRFRAMFALVALLAVLNTLVALALHNDDDEEVRYDDDEDRARQRRGLFAVATLALAAVSAAPWLTSGARLRAEPAAGGGGAAVSVAAAAVVGKGEGKLQRQEEREELRAAAAGGVEMSTAAAASKQQPRDGTASDPEDGRRLLLPSTADAPSLGKGGGQEAAAAALELLPSATTNAAPPHSAADGLVAALRMAASPDGALLLLQFAVVSGACLAFLNNLGEIYRSLEAAAEEQGAGGAAGSGGEEAGGGGHVVFVSLFSVANAAGRLAGGAAPESALRSRGTARPFYLAATTGLVAAASALTAMGAGAAGTGALALLSACFGFGFGSTWSLVPAVLADVFGLQAFAQNYAVAQLAPAAGSFLAGSTVGKFYDATAREQQQQALAAAASSSSSSSSSSSGLASSGAAAASDLIRAAATKAQQLLGGSSSAAAAPTSPLPPRCAGAACFSTAFWLLAALCVAAALSTMVLARRTQSLYQAIGRELRLAHAARRRRGASLRATGGGGAAEAEGAGDGAAGAAAVAGSGGGGGGGGVRKKVVLEEEDL